MTSRPARQQAFDFAQPAHHFDKLHHEATGVVLVWEPKALEKRWTKLHPGDARNAEILASHFGQEDRYITVNEFHSWREVRQLKSLRACYVDIDGSTDLDAALDALVTARMPPPSFVVKSGRGLHLYWELEPTSAKALAVWQRVQNALVAALAGDVKAKDCARVLRLVGSVNSKTNTEVQGLVWSGARWTLHALTDEVLGHRPPRPTPAVAEVRDLAGARVRKGTAAVSGSIYERWHHVYRDMIAIGDHHRLESGSVPEGHRGAYLFLYCVALSWFASPASLVDEVVRAARVWTPDLSSADVKLALQTTLERAEKSAAGETVQWMRPDGSVESVDPRYRFKRQSLYNWMRPIIPDSLLDQLHAIIPDTLAAQRKKARNKARFTDQYTGQGSRASNAEKHAQALVLHAAGGSMRTIAAAVGMSIGTIQKWTR